MCLYNTGKVLPPEQDLSAGGKRGILAGTHCKLFCFVSVGKPEGEVESEEVTFCPVCFARGD